MRLSSVNKSINKWIKHNAQKQKLVLLRVNIVLLYNDRILRQFSHIYLTHYSDICTFLSQHSYHFFVVSLVCIHCHLQCRLSILLRKIKIEQTMLLRFDYGAKSDLFCKEVQWQLFGDFCTILWSKTIILLVHFNYGLGDFIM